MENKEYYEKYVRERFGIPYVSFNNLEIDVIKDIVEALELVFNRYPRLADCICSLGDCEDINNQYNLFINSNKHKKIVWGEYLEDEHEIMNTICYNPGLFPFIGKIKIIKGKMFIPNKFMAIYGTLGTSLIVNDGAEINIKSSSSNIGGIFLRDSIIFDNGIYTYSCLYCDKNAIEAKDSVKLIKGIFNIISGKGKGIQAGEYLYLGEKGGKDTDLILNIKTLEDSIEAKRIEIYSRSKIM